MAAPKTAGGDDVTEYRLAALESASAALAVDLRDVSEKLSGIATDVKILAAASAGGARSVPPWVWIIAAGMAGGGSPKLFGLLADLAKASAGAAIGTP